MENQQPCSFPCPISIFCDCFLCSYRSFSFLLLPFLLPVTFLNCFLLPSFPPFLFLSLFLASSFPPSDAQSLCVLYMDRLGFYERRLTIPFSSFMTQHFWEHVSIMQCLLVLCFLPSCSLIWGLLVENVQMHIICDLPFPVRSCW